MADATFLISYGYVPDMEQRRTPHRPDHLAFLRSAADAGQLVLAGAVADPVDGGVLVVRAADEAAARELTGGDPYVRAGLVRTITVRPIALVVPQ